MRYTWFVKLGIQIKKKPRGARIVAAWHFIIEMSLSISLNVIIRLSLEEAQRQTYGHHAEQPDVTCNC